MVKGAVATDAAATQTTTEIASLRFCTAMIMYSMEAVRALYRMYSESWTAGATYMELSSISVPTKLSC